MLMATPQSDEYKQYATAHYMELIDRYSSDLLWNDVGWPGGGTGALQLMADYYNINENGVVNDRFDMIGVVQGNAHCDYITPEYSSGLTAPGRKFEVCRGIGMSFGYNQLDNETTYASSTGLIHLLINSVADGATYPMILATAQDSFTIPGLPLGAVELLGSSEPVQREGDTISLPAVRPDQPALTFRIP